MNLDEYSFTVSFNFLAELISALTHTPLFAIFVFLVLGFYLSPHEFLVVGGVGAFFGGVLPLAICCLYAMSKNVDFDIPNRMDRAIPLLIVIPSYLVGLIVLYGVSAPVVICVLMFGYFIVAFLVVLISFYWKISLHVMGIAGPSVVLAYVFGLPGLVFGLILVPLVMWSRVYLGRHTVLQVIIGALMGLCLVEGLLIILV